MLLVGLFRDKARPMTREEREKGPLGEGGSMIRMDELTSLPLQGGGVGGWGGGRHRVYGCDRRSSKRRAAQVERPLAASRARCLSHMIAVSCVAWRVSWETAPSCGGSLGFGERIISAKRFGVGPDAT